MRAPVREELGDGETSPAGGVPCWAPSADGAPGRFTTVAPAARISGELTADVAVVGAGLAGLSTAYHLVERDPSLDVVVVDARHPAAGASGRGTGLLGPRVGPSIDRAARRFGPSTARRMHLASVTAVERVITLAGELGTSCGLRTGEQIVATRSAAGLASLARQAETYRALGLDVPVLSAAAIRERVDVPYHAGLLYRSAATLDPTALSGTLVAACAAKGVRFHDDSPLRGLRPGSGAAVSELLFPSGTLRARKTVLAVNAAAGRLGLPVGTVLPLQVHAVATGPLDAEAREALGGATATAVVNSMSLAPYFRLTEDGRLVLGGGRAVHLPGLSPDRAAALRTATWNWLEERLRLLHPRLAEVPVSHRWSGQIGMTLDDLPVVGNVGGHPDLWYIGGCCGHGLAMSVAHGSYVAESIAEPSTTARGPRAYPWHRDRAPRAPLAARPVRGLLRAYLDRLDREARRTP
ncbi:FAD-dependent oxidoreductase [Streptomyces sp. NWU339]|uniref:NAD(P)/FAD-dependent oxidoreductase n=1 Tax=Streptomyces sp. NWU339 TaxID=2185284 RepID=UPI000D675923|nr:FAD-binding oxidoreductase [Streptomyces sp. NWU339]PWI12136.1 FAD-dependent oxidoreductase [Streptomyces sp. NWU339]